jgi:hypothetical protein
VTSLTPRILTAISSVENSTFVSLAQISSVTLRSTFTTAFLVSLLECLIGIHWNLYVRLSSCSTDWCMLFLWHSLSKWIAGTILHSVAHVRNIKVSRHLPFSHPYSKMSPTLMDSASKLDHKCIYLSTLHWHNTSLKFHLDHDNDLLYFFIPFFTSNSLCWPEIFFKNLCDLKFSA